MYKERCSSLVCAITYVGPVLSYLTQQTGKGHRCVQNPGIILFICFHGEMNLCITLTFLCTLF